QLFEFLDPLDFSIIDHLDDKFVLTGRDAALEIYSPNSLVNVTACGKLYQKNLFTKIRFPIGKIHEDEARIPILFYMSQRVVVNCRKMYGYRVREDSIMHKKFSIRRYDAIDAFKECIAF